MKEVFTISDSLKFLFESIETLLNMKFENGILNKIIHDFREDQVNEKQYKLNREIDLNNEKNMIVITGYVHDYEPECLFLQFENLNQKRRKQLNELIENYKFAFGSGADFRTEDDSLAIYNKGITGLMK